MQINLAKAKSILPQRGALPALAAMVVCGALASPAWSAILKLESCTNGAKFTVQGVPGTAGVLGTDFALGTFLAGGNGAKGHGFDDALAFHTGHVCGGVASDTDGPAPDCTVFGPPAFTDTGMISNIDHNWLQGTTKAIVVDLGAGNASDRAIVFNSTDHLGVINEAGCTNADRDLWNKVIEGIEFTVFGTNSAADAAAIGASASREFSSGGTVEAGVVPAAGTGSSFVQGSLVFVFEDGWLDFGNTDEGDDFASVWQFSQPVRFIAVVSDFTDPFLLDGFRSFDNELDAIGRFIVPLAGDINIHPESDPNSINTCSGGTTPVIIWGSSDLDVSKINVNQLVMEGGAVKMVGKSNRSLCNIADVGTRDVAFFDDLDPLPDTFDDLTCHFQTFNLTGLEENDTTADLTIIGCDDPTVAGDLALCEVGDTGFFQFIGTDSVNIVKDCDPAP